jgi:8-oxo-dGTP pyrophosphatase MutT (NUDIX family)
MTDALAGYLRHVGALNPMPQGPISHWSIDGVVVGWLNPAARERLLTAGGLFHERNGQLILDPALRDFDSRSEALAELVTALAAEQRIHAPMGEAYPITAGEREQALCRIDRTAAGYFGIRSFGQHLNGYVREGDQILMWLGRRARDRLIYPGRLDNLVAGGLPYGIDLTDNLVKECYEEAGMPAALARTAQPVSSITYNSCSPRGLKPEVLYCYDLELPADFTPRNTDGEVEEFLLLPLAEVARLVRDTDEFKLNCNLVVVDFLVRHGWITPEQAGYLELVTGLRQRLGSSFAAHCATQNTSG